MAEFCAVYAPSIGGSDPKRMCVKSVYCLCAARLKVLLGPGESAGAFASTNPGESASESARPNPGESASESASESARVKVS